MSAPECPFCRRIGEGDLLWEEDLAVAFADAFPLASGHCLVVPRRHEPDFFALTVDEQEAVWSVLREVQEVLVRSQGPDGFNVGVNAGVAAGQTVAHAHVHLIPRRLGDVEDPRGGVRWILPERAAYWQGGE